MSDEIKPERDRKDGGLSGRQIEAYLDGAPVGVAFTDADQRRIVYANPSLSGLLGSSTDKLFGRPLDDLFADAEDRSAMLAAMENDGALQGHRIRVSAAGGTAHWVALSAELVMAETGARILWWFVDDHDHRMLEQRLGSALLKEYHLHRQLEALNQELEWLSADDPLTGLPGPERFLELGEAELLTARRSGYPTCALVLQVNEFEALRDGQGNAAADDVLKTVANICRQALRQIDILARVEAGEFAAVLPGAVESQCLKLKERLEKAFSVQVKRGLQGRFRFSVSIGVTPFATQDATFEEVLARARQLAQPSPPPAPPANDPQPASRPGSIKGRAPLRAS